MTFVFSGKDGHPQGVLILLTASLENWRSSWRNWIPTNLEGGDNWHLSYLRPNSTSQGHTRTKPTQALSGPAGGTVGALNPSLTVSAPAQWKRSTIWLRYSDILHPPFMSLTVPLPVVRHCVPCSPLSLHLGSPSALLSCPHWGLTAQTPVWHTSLPYDCPQIPAHVKSGWRGTAWNRVLFNRFRL